MIQNDPKGNLQHPSASLFGCQQTAPQSALGLWGKRQLLPPSFSSSCPNRFQTGFPYHTDTLSNVPRCSLPFIWLLLWAVKILSSPLPGTGIHITQFLQPNMLLNCSSKYEQPVFELRHTSLSLHVLGGYGQQSPETDLFETLGDWSAVADNRLGEKTSRIGQAHHWAAHHCRMMHWPHSYAGFNVHHHSFIFTSDFHVTQNRA